MRNNPFQITKATHLDDEGIYKYWVDILENEDKQKSFFEILSLNSSLPLRILGGKGSGKTHLLRFFSYPVQKIKANKKHVDLVTQIQKDGFFCVYLELGNFGFTRFRGRGATEEAWDEWYYYYLNIVLIESFLKIIVDLFEITSLSLDGNTIENICKDYLFIEDITPPTTVFDLFDLFKTQHKLIDKQISRLKMGLIDNFSDISPLFDTRSHIFFSIIESIMNGIPEFTNVKTMLFIDQIEDLSIAQQMFLNNFLRHPQSLKKVVIRVAGRLYAVKTEEAYDAGEKLHESAEIKTYTIESFIKDDLNYKKTHEKFSLRLFKNRLENAGFPTVNDEEIKNNFICDDHVEILQHISNKHPHSIERIYFKAFQKNLFKYQKRLSLSDQDIETIVTNLSCSSKVLLEKTNVFLFYQDWSSSKNLVESSLAIKKSNISYQKHEKGKNRHKTALRLHKEDLIRQLYRDYSKPYQYCGFNTIMSMTYDNPRNFISILKYTYNNASFFEEAIFSYDSKLSSKVQDISIREASSWFWDNAILDVNSTVIGGIARLCEYFREAQFSDKPVEKTLISFAYYVPEAPDYINTYIDDALARSLLIEDKNGKKAKNDPGKILRKININPMLSPKWDLPVTVGGTAEINCQDLEAIFCTSNDDWKTKRTLLTQSLNIPFSVKKPVKKTNKPKHQQGKLTFDE